MTKRASTLETLIGATDGVHTTGVFPLTSELVEGGTPTTQISIPKGIRAKIWLQKISGQPTTVSVFVNPNPLGVTFPGVVMPTNTNVQVDSTGLTSAGVLQLDDRRPLVLDSRNFATAAVVFYFTWAQATAGLATITVLVEWTTIGSEE